MRKPSREAIATFKGTVAGGMCYQAITADSIPVLGLSAGVAIALVIHELSQIRKLKLADAQAVLEVIKKSLKAQGLSEKKINEFLLDTNLIDRKGRAKLPPKPRKRH